jgi:hypothetical protein
MKLGLIFGLCLYSQVIFADGLPVITVQPTNLTVYPGGTAVITVTATGATSFQWRFNGMDIPNATNSSLQISNVQSTNTGYYMVVTGNATGRVPSQMTYLSIDYTQGEPLFMAGTVPFSNKTNDYTFGQVIDYSGSPLSGSARVVAGPQLDQMIPFGTSVTVTNGYYGNSAMRRTVSTVAPGQNVYYRVDVTFTNYAAYTLPSTVLKLTAGGGSFPVPSAYGLKFPFWPEWPEPTLVYTTPTNQVRILGETFSLTNQYWAWTDFGIPTAYWRKDGNPIPGGTNFTQTPYGFEYQSILMLTNTQTADAGIYDLVVLGNLWLTGPKTTLSVQVTNGFGILISPRWSGTNFVCDLLGAAGRYYAIQWSTNLTDWHNFTTQYNAAGTITFTNYPVPGSAQFFRARLQP